MSLVTLTFDNGPTVHTTPLVLQELAARNLCAYFCLIGSQLEHSQEQVDIAKETAARGHRLMNHSLTHGVALGDDPSPEHANNEVVSMHRLMGKHLGDWGSHWFRPFGRGGEIGQHLLSRPAVQALQAFDYSVLLWNSVPRDWEDAEGWVETALAEIAVLDHAVVVLHDLNTGAMAHLGRFLDALLERGDEMTTALPQDCVPMRDGSPAWDQDAFKSIITDQPS